MEFELWLYAIKQLAQNYEMSQVIYSQLTKQEQDALHEEYERTVGGGTSDSTSKKKTKSNALKTYGDLIDSFHNAMSITERFVEKNNIKYLNDSCPIDEKNPDEEFLRRVFLNMEMSSIQVIQYLNYISKSVSAEGEIEKNGDSYSLNGNEIKDGMLIEFFHMNRWEIGRLCKSPGAVYGYFILGFHNEITDVELNGLHARIRG